MEISKVGLKDLVDIQPIYILPEDDLLTEVIIPGLREASSYDCLIGFFHSNALKEMAPGLAEFLTRSDGTMRLTVSPFLSSDDQDAIKKGVETSVEVLASRLEEVYGSARTDTGALTRHTLECLAYLIAAHRIEIKVVLVRNGLFHPKVRIFSDDKSSMVVHGSNNMTQSGLRTNFEQVVVSRSWVSEDQRLIVRRLQDEFDAIWRDDKGENIKVFDFPQALKEQIVREYSSERPPTQSDFWSAWKRDENDSNTDQPVDIQQGFKIPPGIEYQQGDFAHQGEAINAWEAAGRRGILEMATGSGKTIAALIASRRLADDVKPLLVTVAVPYLPLIAQWAEEACKFGLAPLIPGNETRKREKLALVQGAIRRLRLGVSEVEFLVITHDFLCDKEFQSEVGRFKGAALLIGDEVHHLGTPAFLTSKSDGFEYRLGLSATPIRQYDDTGTVGLMTYFGDVVFQFTLEQAIGKCLVPYDYFLHEVQLTGQEVDKWLDLTEQLRKVGWKFGGQTEGGTLPADLQRLLMRRRSVMEQAENKIPVFRDVLKMSELRNIRHTLVYASDKGRKQLQQVNRLLMDELNLRIHQITQEETGNRRLIKELLGRFSRGNEIQILTAMRVLDEGLDIPEVSTAYILASTTVERQWVQRRGRVLRTCSRIDKQFASIHDFIVVPPPEHSGGGISKIIEMELKRVLEFARTSRNASSAGGALNTVTRLIQTYL